MNKKIDKNTAIVYLYGKMNRKSLKALGMNVDYKRKNVTLDLADVRAIDSSGVGFLVKLQKRANDYGREVMLVNPNQEVQMFLELTKIDQVFQIVDNINQAPMAA